MRFMLIKHKHKYKYKYNNNNKYFIKNVTKKQNTVYDKDQFKYNLS